MKQSKLGSGERFKKLKEKLSHNPKIKNPGAAAAAIGAKKFGQKKMTELAVKGKKHSK